MGGFGSGSWQIGKPTTAAAIDLDLNRLHQLDLVTRPGERSEVITWSRSGRQLSSARVQFRWEPASDAAELTLSYEISSKPVRCPIVLSRATRPWGAWYWRAVCPLDGRLARRLYLHPPRSPLFASRQALGLVYPSTRDDALGAIGRHQERVAWRLERAGIGLESGQPGPRPPGMHLRRYERLCREYADARFALFYDALFADVHGRTREADEDRDVRELVEASRAR